MALHGFFLLLLVAKSMALWDLNSGISSWNTPGRARAVPTRCTQQGNFCSNCQESYLCATPTSTPFVNACSEPNTVCTGTPGRAACRNFVGTSVGDCDCDTVDNVGFIADPYDSTKYFICIAPEGQFLQTCPDGLVFSAEEKGCVEASVTDIIQVDSTVPCTTNPIGFYTNDPTCQTYTVCISDSLPGIFGTCPNGEAFDSSKPGCVDQCSLGPTTFACQPGVSGSLGDSGAFPDSFDCTIFHVCSNGALISTNSCPNGQLFNFTPTTMGCVAASTGVVCPVINPCWAAYCDACPGTCPTDSSSGTDTSNPPIDPNGANSSPDTIVTTPAGDGSGTPSCNTNTTGYFEYAADCKKFWSCQDDDAGGHEPILYRCPGTLVYIPSTKYCSLQSDLPTAPGCITS